MTRVIGHLSLIPPYQKVEDLYFSTHRFGIIASIETVFGKTDIGRVQSNLKRLCSM